jgi:hypothetical protein
MKKIMTMKNNSTLKSKRSYLERKKRKKLSNKTKMLTQIKRIPDPKPKKRSQAKKIITKSLLQSKRKMT